MYNYATDNYPQGRDYCLKLINGGLKENECFHIIAREDGEKWTRYYFKSKYININPTSVCLLSKKSQLESQLNIIKSNKSIFPQGIEHCMETIQSQIEANGEVFIVKENKMISYFLPEQVKYFCNCEWRSHDHVHEIHNVEEISASESNEVVQGSEYSIKLLEESKKRNGFYRVFIKNTRNVAFFFYFSDDYD